MSKGDKFWFDPAEIHFNSFTCFACFILKAFGF